MSDLGTTVKTDKKRIDCIRYIHNNPVKAKIVDNPINYKFSSYKDYYYKKGISLNKKLKELIDTDYILKNFSEEYNFIDVDIDIKSIIQCVKGNLLIEKMTKEEKCKIVYELKCKYNVPYKKSCLELDLNERTFRRKMSALQNVPKTDKEENCYV